MTRAEAEQWLSMVLGPGWQESLILAGADPSADHEQAAAGGTRAVELARGCRPGMSDEAAATVREAWNTLWAEPPMDVERLTD